MSISRRVAALAVLSVLVAPSPAIRAQPLGRVLAAAKTLTCEFPVLAVGTWKNGEPEAEVNAKKPLVLRFEEINSDEGTAQLIGGIGRPTEIVARLSGSMLNFIQVFAGGPLYTTTVFASESRRGKLKAAHSRHEYFEFSLPGFTSRPEQYYGDCEVVP